MERRLTTHEQIHFKARTFRKFPAHDVKEILPWEDMGPKFTRFPVQLIFLDAPRLYRPNVYVDSKKPNPPSVMPRDIRRPHFDYNKFVQDGYRKRLKKYRISRRTRQAI